MKKGGGNLAISLFDQFLKLFNDPKAEEAIISFLKEHTDAKTVSLAENIFSDSEKREKFLKTDFKNEFKEIWKKTPKYDKNALIEMEQLINDKSTKEKNMRGFFLKYPWFFGFEYIELQTQQKLGEKKILDYLLKDINGNYNLLEIKGPNDHIFNKKKENNQFTHNFINGLVQLMGYIDYCDMHHDYIFSEHKKNIYKPKGILLIDNNLEAVERDALRMFRSFLHRINIVTYDELHNAAKNALKYV